MPSTPQSPAEGPFATDSRRQAKSEHAVDAHLNRKAVQTDLSGAEVARASVDRRRCGCVSLEHGSWQPDVAAFTVA